MEIVVHYTREYAQTVLAVLSIIVMLVSLVYALGSRSFRHMRMRPIELEAPKRELDEARSLIAAVSAPHIGGAAVPFETEHLARYYAQILLQSRVAFWFSLVFASLGFFVIVAGALLYAQDKAAQAIAQGIAGLVVDAVAALFFVQSKGAQSSMTEFFDKLRKDRQQAESRKLCDEVEDPSAKDALRIQLSLYYAGLDDHSAVAHQIAADCLANSAGTTTKETAGNS